MRRVRRELRSERVSDHLTFAVRDVAGQQLDIDVRIGTVTVDLVHHGLRLATFERRRLVACLGRPQGELTTDDVTWTATPGGVLLTIPFLFVSYRLQAADLGVLVGQVRPSRPSLSGFAGIKVRAAIRRQSSDQEPAQHLDRP